jgi:hypothetical protein
MCVIIVPLTPGKTPFAVTINNNIRKWRNRVWMYEYISTHSPLNGGDWSASCHGRFTPREITLSYRLFVRTPVWMGPRISLEAVVKREMCGPVWNQNLILREISLPEPHQFWYKPEDNMKIDLKDEGFLSGIIWLKIRSSGWPIWTQHWTHLGRIIFGVYLEDLSKHNDDNDDANIIKIATTSAITYCYYCH